MGLLEETLKTIQPQDAKWRQQARERLEQLAMPPWALGRLMDMAEDLAGMTRSMAPEVDRKAVVVMAGDHGVVEEGVSPYPQDVTGQMVRNFVSGGAGINAVASAAGAKVVVVNMGVKVDLSDLAASDDIVQCAIANGTANMVKGPAMSREDAVGALEAGIRVANNLDASVDVFGSGDMGIGNTTPSGAIAVAVIGEPASRIAGRGTGVDEAGLRRKVAAIEASLALNQPDPSDGVDVLSKVGGFEIGGIAGLILGSAALHKPVVIDGFISTAGAIVASLVSPTSMDYVIASHVSAERGHGRMLAHLNLQPLVDLGLRLGEGTGAALVMPMVDTAARILTRVKTFAEAAVSGKES